MNIFSICRISAKLMGTWHVFSWYLLPQNSSAIFSAPLKAAWWGERRWSASMAKPPTFSSFQGVISPHCQRPTALFAASIIYENNIPKREKRTCCSLRHHRTGCKVAHGKGHFPNALLGWFKCSKKLDDIDSIHRILSIDSMGILHESKDIREQKQKFLGPKFIPIATWAHALKACW